MQRAKLTDVAFESLKHVAREHGADRWARSRRSGERPSLAALHARGLVVRRAWRGTAGEADAAYEYRLSQSGLEILRELKKPANTDFSAEQATPEDLPTGP